MIVLLLFPSFISSYSCNQTNQIYCLHHISAIHPCAVWSLSLSLSPTSMYTKSSPLLLSHPLHSLPLNLSTQSLIHHFFWFLCLCHANPDLEETNFEQYNWACELQSRVPKPCHSDHWKINVLNVCSLHFRLEHLPLLTKSIGRLVFRRREVER